MEVTTTRHSWVVLAIIVVNATLNNAQRFCTGYLGLAFIAGNSDLLRDTQMTNAEFGFIMGPAFLCSYALFAIPMVTASQARVVDLLPRLKLFFLVTSAGFSISTGLSSLATSYGDLVWPRILFGLFSACVNPACIRLIALYFPPNARGLAYSLFMASVYIGSSLASQCIVLCSHMSWQAVILLIGASSCVLVLITGVFLKDLPNVHTAPDIGSLLEDARELVKNRTLVLSTIALFFRYSGGFARGFFEPLFLSTQFPEDKVMYSICNSLTLLAAPIALALAGKFTDSWEAQGHLQARPLLCCIASLLPVPCLCLMYLLNSFPVAIASLFMVNVIGEVYISVGMATLINVTTPRVRALRKTYTETGVATMVAFLGGTANVLILGIVSSSHDQLKLGLLCLVTPCYFCGGVAFYLISRVYPADYRKAHSSPLNEALLKQEPNGEETT